MRQMKFADIFCIIALQAFLTHSGIASNYLVRDDEDVPCGYFDTVNLTDSHKFANGSYLYDGVVIPKELVGVYAYEFRSWVERVPVRPHVRGCICLVRACINICCAKNEVYNTSSNNGTMCVNPEPDVSFNSSIAILGEDGTVRAVDFFKHFVVQTARPCDQMYILTPELFDYDAWTLFENGTLLREDDHKYHAKNDYCFAPQKVHYNSTVYVLNPLNCYEETGNSLQEILNSYTMVFSVPFMLLTILIYMAIPELRNLHGKTLSSYLFGLVVGYSLLAYIIITGAEPFSEGFCATIGYTTYFFFMGAFFWLNVISFDLWWNFRGTKGIGRFNEKKRFLIYFVYAWGMAGLFLVFTYVAQNSGMPDEWKPSIGSDSFCFLNLKFGWSGLVYMYGPVLIIITVNTILFILTALKIHTVQKEMTRIMEKEDSQRNLRNEKDKFGLFLRLFLIMGVTWSTEIISYFFGSKSQYAKLFYISDIFNAIQGFLIFALFVLKKKVKYLIIKRYQTLRGIRTIETSRTSQCSTKTTTSSLGISMNNVSVEKPLIGRRHLPVV